MMDQRKHPAVRPRRLFVSGGSCLSQKAEKLWVELGRALAREHGLVVITGGLKHRMDRADSNPADWAVFRGMRDALKNDKRLLPIRCETVLPDRGKDWRKLKRFRGGKVTVLPGRTSQSRRFSMTNSADVVVSLEGEMGTSGVLDMALAVDKPILPLPFGKPDSEGRENVSVRRWKAHRPAIKEWFQIKEEEARKLERTRLEELSSSELVKLAGQISEWLSNGFTRNCFVMMPFKGKSANEVYDKAIRPSLKAHGLRAVRTDRLGLTGDVVDCIRRALDSCYIAVADTTGDRPNVMYELGMAHADRKPVVLLRRTGSRAIQLPFDIQTEQCITYGRDLRALRGKLNRTLDVLLGKSVSLDDE